MTIQIVEALGASDRDTAVAMFNKFNTHVLSCKACAERDKPIPRTKRRR
jgi:hypothetical protein